MKSPGTGRAQERAHEKAQQEIQQKYLTFMLGEEEYGIPVLQVAEIVKVENLIKIPHSRNYFLGLMDIRGKVLPIVDLKRKLAIQTDDEDRPPEVGAKQADASSTGEGAKPETAAAQAVRNARKKLDRAIIINMSGRRIGLAVDQVSHVVRFPPESIDPGPPSLKSAASKFVTGVGKNKDEFVVLMNLNHLFTEDEISGLFHVPQ